MNIGLFFGSFNPIHVGHCLIAMYAREEFALDQVWFVVSPQNPLKKINTNDYIGDITNVKPEHLSEYSHKFKMVKSTCEKEFEEYGKFVAKDIEYKMPTPSYTSKTLKKIKKENPEDDFYIIMGSDCFNEIEKWKDYKYILKNFPLFVYPRTGSSLPLIMDGYDTLSSGTKIPGMVIKTFGHNQLMDISSTQIRQREAEHKSIQFMVPKSVRGYLVSNWIYRPKVNPQPQDF